MIIYDLSCDNKHHFEGWFRSPEDFDTQIERHLVRCPQCDSANVRRIPSAVAIGGHLEPVGSDGASGEVARTGTTALMPASTHVAAVYRQFVQAIISDSEDVGTSFADEARKIHYNEAPERSIRGQVTPDECEALRDEGIDVLHLPAFKEEDLN